MVTDSSACLPPELAAELGVLVVPLRIHLGARTLLDSHADARQAVDAAQRAGDEVKSSAPPPTDYLTAAEDGDATDAVVITPAVEFTAMFRSATVASRLTTRPCAVVDCRAVAAGQALIVIAAARAALAGAGHDEVVRVAERASRRSQMVAAVGSLTYLGRSGRVPSATVEAASRGGQRSVFRVREGHVDLLAAMADDAEAVERMASVWRAATDGRADDTVVFHAANPTMAGALNELVGAPLLTEFSPAMALHTGPGVVGVAWLDLPES